SAPQERWEPPAALPRASDGVRGHRSSAGRGVAAPEQRTGPRNRLDWPLDQPIQSPRWSRPGPCSRRTPATGFGAVRTGMKRHLEALLRQALNDAITAGELPVDRPPPFTVEVPADLKFADLATNVALVLARQVGRPPRAVADTLLARIRDREGWLAATEVAGPGFINFRFAPSFWRMLLAEALAAGESYGRSTVGAGRRVREELVDIARALAAEQGDERATLPEAEAVARCRDFAAGVLLAAIQEDLARFGVPFDHFVSERALHAESVFARARAALPADLLYEQDGALFFRTTRF